MSSPPSRPRRRRLALSDEAPQGRRALAFAAIWLALGIALLWASVLFAVHVGWWPPLRLVVAFLIATLGSLALMLASDSAERWLDGRYSQYGNSVYWFATSLVTLTAIVLLGAVMTSLVRDRPGFWNVTLDFGLDLGLGLIGGTAAAAAILLTGAVLGGLIYEIQSRLGSQRRAGRWQAPPTSERPLDRARGPLMRGAALGAVGLLLSAVCTAIVATVTTNRTGGAEAPAPVEASGWWTVGAPLLLWLAGTAAVWFLLTRRSARHGHKGPRAPHRRTRHGTQATALGIGLVLLFAWFNAQTVKSEAEHRLWAGEHPANSIEVTAQQWSRSSPYLARQFEPRFSLTRNERWSPTSVSWYLQQSGGPTHGTQACKVAGCYRIRRAGCDAAGVPADCAPSGAADPALYYRYFDSSDPIRKPRVPSGSWKLIEYWLFYNYDSLHAGVVTQWHQGDWEQVSVLVRRTGTSVRPVEVAFSEHCYGARLPAERVEWAEVSHPVVFVANGSHANYPRPVSVPVRQLRCSLGLTPRYFGVAGLFFAPAFDGTSLELPLEYVGGVRDRATNERSLPALPLVSLLATPAVAGFKGYWGLDNNLTFFGIGRARTGAGPPAPPNQGPWIQPFSKLLCSDSWLHPRPRRRSETSWVCRVR
jgi:hypothetical protein